MDDFFGGMATEKEAKEAIAAFKKIADWLGWEIQWEKVEMCRRLKKNAELQDIPIVFVAAKGDTEDIVQGFEAGAVDFIMKPFRQEEVCARVKSHLTLLAAIKKLIRDSETDSLTDLINR